MATAIHSIEQCISSEEKKQRFGVTVVNALLWVAMLIATVASFGGFIIIAAITWFLNYLFSELNVRKLLALGAGVSPQQFPAVYQAMKDVKEQFRITQEIRVLVIARGDTNAFSIRFAQKRVILILSELLEGVIDHPEELRALLAHEMCHQVLDHGWRGRFELYKPMKYRMARELTCDNAGYAASGNLESTITLMKKTCVGQHLHNRLSTQALVEEARYLYSGIVGYFLRRSLSHPPTGARVENLQRFAANCERQIVAG